tara:strand:- start:1610 stop:2338 length:729 start_codon:yes stop_codon:yes gene_type:complete
MLPVGFPLGMQNLLNATQNVPQFLPPRTPMVQIPTPPPTPSRLNQFFSNLTGGGLSGFLGGFGNAITGLPVAQLLGSANTPMSSIGGLLGLLPASGTLGNLGQAQLLGSMIPNASVTPTSPSTPTSQIQQVTGSQVPTVTTQSSPKTINQLMTQSTSQTNLNPNQQGLLSSGQLTEQEAINIARDIAGVELSPPEARAFLDELNNQQNMNNMNNINMMSPVNTLTDPRQINNAINSRTRNFI